MNKEALKDLSSFTGTEQYHMHSVLFKKFLHSDGVHHLCENADCYWLLDLIALHQSLAMKDESLRSIQFWKLSPLTWPEHAPGTMGAMMEGLGKLNANPVKNSQGGTILSYTRSEGRKPMARVIGERDTDDIAFVQDLDYTDFPFDAMPEAIIWVEPTTLPDGSQAMVAYLPSEH